MTTVQKLAITMAVLGFLAGAGTQLTDIFAPIGSAAPIIVKEIVSLSGFVGGILGVVLSFLTGQSGQIKAVQSMPGVDKIVVNAQASPALAQIAVDPNSKVEPTPQAAMTVQQTANQA